MFAKVHISFAFFAVFIFQAVSQNPVSSKYLVEADSLYHLTTGTIRIVELKELRKNKPPDKNKKKLLEKTLHLYQLALKNEPLNPTQKLTVKNRISVVYYQLQQPEKAIKTLEEVLLNKSLDILTKIFGQNLLELYKDKKEYRKIIDLYQRINLFKQEASCRNQRNYERLYFSSVLAEACLKTGQYEKSLKYSLNLIFLAEIEKEQNLIKIIRQSLQNLYTNEELQKELNQSLKHPYRTGKNIHSKYFIDFLGYHIEIPYYYVERKNNQLIIKEEKFKNSSLYQIIFQN